MINQKFYLLIILALLVVSKAKSQKEQTDKPIFFSVGAYYGYFQVHTGVLSSFEGVNPNGVELELSQWLLTDKVKHMFGIYPRWSLGVNYVDFDHPDLGYALGAVAYAEPFLKVNGSWKFSAKLGAGLSYMSNPYDQEKNPLNRTYSTGVAFPLIGGLSAYHFFNRQWAVKTTVSFRHISNGGIRQPNLGINYPVLSIALEHTSNRYNITPVQKLNPYEKENRIELLVGYSSKEDTLLTKRRHVLTATFNKTFRGGRINTFTLGGIAEVHESPEEWGIAPLVGNEFLLGRLRFGQQIGVYLLQPSNAPNIMLQNYYLRYLISGRFSSGVGLKAHGRVADYLSVQLGIIF